MGAWWQAGRQVRRALKLGPQVGLVLLAAFLVGGWTAGVLLLPGLTTHSSQASTAEPQIIMSLSLPFPWALWGPRGCLDAFFTLATLQWWLGPSIPCSLGAVTALPSLL